MIEGNAKTKVSILGYKSELVEYVNNFDASIKVAATPIGLGISAVNGQRFYTNRRWPNAVVMKIENAKFKAPVEVKTSKSGIDGAK
jgi:alpha-L-fucosidase